MVQGEPGRRMVRRGIRWQANLRCRTRWVALYGNDRLDDDARKRYLRRVDEVLGPDSRRLIRRSR